jgi:hypothetical protein
MSFFDEVLGHVDMAVDDIYGEYFSYEPRAETINGESQADPDRTALAQVRGVFSDEAQHLAARADGAGGLSPGYISDPPRFSFVQSQLPFPVRRLDRFARLRDGTIYEVVAVLPDGVNRTKVELVELP